MSRLKQDNVYGHGDLGYYNILGTALENLAVVSRPTLPGD